MRAEPAIRNPRTRVKPEWTPSRRSWRVPGYGDRAAPSRIYKTPAANSRLQVRPRARTHVVFLMKIGKISAGRPVLPRFWFATNRQGRLAPVGWRWLHSPRDDLGRKAAVSTTNTGILFLGLNSCIGSTIFLSMQTSHNRRYRLCLNVEHREASSLKTRRNVKFLPSRWERELRTGVH